MKKKQIVLAIALVLGSGMSSWAYAAEVAPMNSAEMSSVEMALVRENGAQPAHLIALKDQSNASEAVAQADGHENISVEDSVQDAALNLGLNDLGNAQSLEVGEEFADPYERFNRGVFTFNDTADRAVTKPIARAYTKIVPKPVRQCGANFFENLSMPYTALNNFLQGKPKSGFQDIGRFLVNSTIGLGGCLDVATDMGVPKHKEDFGQTLAVWGVPSGPYIVLPILGPSTVRDALSKPVDFFGNPIGYITNVPLRNSGTGYSIINTRAGLLDTTDLLQNAALDPYAMARDAWLQNRAAQIKDEDGSYEVHSDEQPRKIGAAPDDAVAE